MVTFTDKVNEYCDRYSNKKLAQEAGCDPSCITSYRDGSIPKPERKAIISEIIGYSESEEDEEFHQEIEFVDLEEAAARIGWGISKLQSALRAREFSFGGGFPGKGEKYNYYILRKPFEDFIKENRIK